jgi:hypothetical protein
VIKFIDIEKVRVKLTPLFVGELVGVDAIMRSQHGIGLPEKIIITNF